MSRILSSTLEVVSLEVSIDLSLTEMWFSVVESDANMSRKEQETRYLDLFSLRDGEDEFDVLKLAVLKYGGAVQIWVHTHFQDESAPEDIERGTGLPGKELIVYRENRSKFIGSVKEGMPVIVLMESIFDFNLGLTMKRRVQELFTGWFGQRSDQDLERYKRFYKDLLGAVKIYYVITEPTSPTPKASRLIGDDEKWDVLADRLNSLGVRKAVYRGTQLEIGRRVLVGRDYDDWGELTYAMKYGTEEVGGYRVDLPMGCVGYAMVELEARGIKILPSRWTYPERMVSRPGNGCRIGVG